jgi:hypothetical protein
VSIDYGTMNAFAALLWANYNGIWYGVREYYYSGRTENRQKTDEEYAKDLDVWLSDVPLDRLLTIVDPSAASFIAVLRKHPRYKVMKAINDVENGIRETGHALKYGFIKVSPKCVCWKEEISGYSWDKDSVEDMPVKLNDHLMDSMRYFVKTKYIIRKNIRRTDK